MPTPNSRRPTAQERTACRREVIRPPRLTPPRRDPWPMRRSRRSPGNSFGGCRPRPVSTVSCFPSTGRWSLRATPAAMRRSSGGSGRWSDPTFRSSSHTTSTQTSRPRSCAQSTALVSYQEHPHIDTKARGVRAARIVAETVRGAAKPVQALVKPPMLYNIVLPASTHELRRLPGASAHPRGQGRRSAPRGIRADGGPHHRGRHGWSDGGEPCQAHLHARSPASVWSRRVRAGKRARRNSAAAHSDVAGTPPASVAAQRAESPASGVLEEFKGGHRPGGLGNI